jgi:transcriptional regulator with XRE-family HTH domain
MGRIARVQHNIPKPIRQVEELPVRKVYEKTYDPVKFPQAAHVLCKEHGFTKAQLAEVFGVPVATLQGWINKYDEFQAAVLCGMDEFDSNVVERKLLQRATGYEYEEKTISEGFDRQGNRVETVTRSIKQQAPDVKAATFWLTNRRKNRWKQESQVNNVVSGGVTAHTDRTLKITADLSKMDVHQLKALRDMIQVQSTNEVHPADIENNDITHLIEYAHTIT